MVSPAPRSLGRPDSQPTIALNSYALQDIRRGHKLLGFYFLRYALIELLLLHYENSFFALLSYPG